MGLYIEGIEEPIAGQVIEIAEGIDGKIYARINPGFDNWHQVHYISAHGRLIDADYLEDSSITYYALPACANAMDLEADLVIRLGEIDNAPTIIPAESI